MADAHNNFAVSSVAVAPAPPLTGLALGVAAGDGVLFPDPAATGPYNVIVSPAGVEPSHVNAEIVRVTARAVDTLTIVRAQEGSAGRAIQVGDRVVHSVTKKTLLDAEAALNALARASGYVAWTFDPAASTFAGTQANTHLAGVYLSEGDVVTGIAVPVSVAGVAVTFAKAGIYDSGLNLVAQSADQSAQFAATGWKSCDLTAPYTVPKSGLYYLATGFAAATTLPTVINRQTVAVISNNYPAGGKPRAVHAQVPAGALPNPAVSQGTFTNIPLLIAY